MLMRKEVGLDAGSIFKHFKEQLAAASGILKSKLKR
jgi:hypothetical protein